MSGPQTRRRRATITAAGTFRPPTGMIGSKRGRSPKKAPDHVTGISASGPDNRASAHVPARARATH